MSEPRKIRLDQRQCGGDVLVLTAAIKALHLCQPGAFLTDYVGHHGRLSDGNNLFANNPYMTEMQPWEGQHVMCDYGYAICQAGRSYHFLHGYVEFLSRKLGVHIELKDFRGDVYLNEEERQPWPGLPERYAIIDAGIKRDFTAKGWSVHRYQEVVDATRGQIEWVQIGSAADLHTPLNGVHNLIGHTNLRQLIRVVYRSSLVLTPVSMPMHLAAAVPTIDGKIRPAVVLAGQREQRQWELYPGHTMLGTAGKLACGVGPGEACWRNKTVQIDNDTNLCLEARQDEVGAWVPECLHRVTTQHVVDAIQAYL